MLKRSKLMKLVSFRRSSTKKGMSKIYTDVLSAVQDIIKSGDCVMVGGFGLCGVPHNLLNAVREIGCNNLHIISNEGGLDSVGVDILIRNNQVKRMTLSYIGANRELQRRYFEGKIACTFLPQGTFAEAIRAGGAGFPAFYTPSGVGTVVQNGGFPMQYSLDGEVITVSQRKTSKFFNGKEYILEEALLADVSLIKAWKGDTEGNLIFRRTERNFNIDMAKAAKITVAEIEHLVPIGSIDPDEVHLPGIYVDRVVQAKCQNFTEAGVHKASESQNANRIRHDIAKRAAREFKNGMYVNLGIGIPALACSYLSSGQSVFLQSENGLLGVGPSASPDNGDAHLTDASKTLVTYIPGASIISSSDAFAMIRGSHLDITVLGAFEVAQNGDLASWIIPGKMVKGMGGAMDLVSSDSRVIVVTTHTTRAGKPKIVKSCTLPLTGKQVVDTIITELCVFKVLKGKDALLLTELRNGATEAMVREKTSAAFTLSENLIVSENDEQISGD